MGRAVTLLVCGNAEAAGELAGELCALGFSARPASTRGAAAALDTEPADAIVALEPLEDATGLPARAIVSVAGAFDGAHAIIVPPAHPIQIAGRVRSLLRLGVLEETARLRLADLGDAGHLLHKPEQKSGPISVLYAGPPDPAYLRLEHALERANAQTVAAFSTFNAFDYLHERAFDAVVLNTRPKPDVAHTVCSAMRRNTRLYHTPTVLLSHDEVYRAADEAFARGASDILPASLDADDLAARILALAGERRRRRLSKGLLESCRVSAVLDGETDLFNDAFGRRHLSSLVDLAQKQALPLALIGLKASVPGAAGPSEGRHASGALNQFASMLRHCVRAEDLAVRLSANTFYLALPGTSAADAQIVAARVAAIAECTAYEGEDPQTPFRIVLRHEVTDTRPGDKAQTLVSRALTGLQQERASVAAV
ncbi:GGDEF domain-containing protein [Glycocaulis albus]|jgi:two-component system cell cycle response regulator PopA|uniref:GGDEF domain-containing protein n=1 Tax=Glycocaulis albus TaxID=1382801 RepID=A0ABQ1XFR0_9PROT|nr:diguanylate cyclase [Glycocaulis albus]MBV5261286.1 diguanylate cyclase [Synechococcus moorigangaii CMS01]GGG93161.1 GGDEF domain-containing protein [Glycocaulis albus]